MGLQAVYVILCLYGWHEWLHGGAGSAPLKVSRAPLSAVGGGIVAGGLFLLGLGTLLRRLTSADLPYLDSSLASFSLVAQFYQTRKWIENWIVWIAVDAVYIGMYIYKQLYFTTSLYAIFLVLATLGYAQWRDSMKAVAEPAR
jgi:nicotinamide mononucleotide transporter